MCSDTPTGFALPRLISRAKMPYHPCSQQLSTGAVSYGIRSEYAQIAVLIGPSLYVPSGNRERKRLHYPHLATTMSQSRAGPLELSTRNRMQHWGTRYIVHCSDVIRISVSWHQNDRHAHGAKLLSYCAVAVAGLKLSYCNGTSTFNA